jgi:hypothetical protein
MNQDNTPPDEEFEEWIDETSLSIAQGLNVPLEQAQEAMANAIVEPDEDEDEDDDE